MNKSNIEIYQLEDGRTEINVQLDKETVWLSLNQMVELFGRDKSVISRHISNVFKEAELDRDSAVTKNATTATDGKVYQVDFYNLDVIISVGYRIKSQRGIQFRIWANKILKEYLVQGYALNEKRMSNHYEKLKELQESVKILGNVLNYKSLTNNESKGLLQIISDYAYALDVLDQYDYQTLDIKNTSGKGIWHINYEEAMAQILMVKKHMETMTCSVMKRMTLFKALSPPFINLLMGRTYIPALKKRLPIFSTSLLRITPSRTGIRGLLLFCFYIF